jgi:hypothetical protein
VRTCALLNLPFIWHFNGVPLKYLYALPAVSYICNFLLFNAVKSLLPLRINYKTDTMKNEPVVTYNHMEEDESSHSGKAFSAKEKSQVPISIYMIFTVDLILISALIYLAVRAIF